MTKSPTSYYTIKCLVLPCTLCCQCIEECQGNFFPYLSDDVCQEVGTFEVKKRRNAWVLLFMLHQVTIRFILQQDFDDCVTGMMPSTVLMSLLGLISGHSVVTFHCNNNCDSSSGFTELRKISNILESNILEVISLCVSFLFLLQVF